MLKLSCCRPDFVKNSRCFLLKRGVSHCTCGTQYPHERNYDQDVHLQRNSAPSFTHTDFWYSKLVLLYLFTPNEDKRVLSLNEFCVFSFIYHTKSSIITAISIDYNILICNLRYPFSIYTYHGNQTNWNDKHVKRSAFRRQPTAVKYKNKLYERSAGKIE